MDSHWNYRVIEHRSKTDKTWFGIHEVYYHSNGTVRCWTEDSVRIVHNTLAELHDDHLLMAEAFMSPVLVEVEGKIIS